MPKRLALAAGTFLICFLILEVLARAFLPMPAPVRLSDLDEHVYINTLPLVNGIPMDTAEFPNERHPLPLEKAPGETRIFVFGESSAVGGPWGYACASATLLAKMLAKAYPDRRFTVVNMGRSGSYTMDAYYYLLTIERYGPDIVIYYNGNNDRYDADAEMCLPGALPFLHAPWRILVEHSFLFRTLRIQGPRYLGGGRSLGAPVEPTEPPCDPAEGFRGWANTLVKTARRTGAQVIVTLPVVSTLAEVDLWEAPGPRGTPSSDCLAGKSRPYLELLRRWLEGEPDFAGALKKYISQKSTSQYSTFAATTLADRQEALKAATRRFGGKTVDLPGRLRALSPAGMLGPPLIFDEVHLSPKGYWVLADLWLQAIASELEGAAVPQVSRTISRDPAVSANPFISANPGTSANPDASAHPTALESRTFESDPNFLEYKRSISKIHEQRLVFEGLRYLEMGRALMAATMLEQAADQYGNETAKVALGWLALRLGLTPALPPELISKAEHFELRTRQPPAGQLH